MQMIRQLVNGFINIILLFALIVVILLFIFIIAYSITFYTWANLIWGIPLFLGMCYVFGEDNLY